MFLVPCQIHMIELPGILVNGFYSLTVFTKDVYQRSKYPFSDISEGCRHASWALKSFYYTWSNHCIFDEGDVYRGYDINLNFVGLKYCNLT